MLLFGEPRALRLLAACAAAAGEWLPLLRQLGWPTASAWAGAPALLVATAVVDWFARRRARPEPVLEPELSPPRHVPPPPAAAPDVLKQACELARRATAAGEAALWAVNPEVSRAVRLASAAPGEGSSSPERVDLEGHPFGWAVREQAYVHLERGRKPLPTEWAVEMLLIPLPAADALLALAYAHSVPHGAEGAAVAAGAHLGEVLQLLRDRERAAHQQEQTAALLNAVRELPHELQIERFAERLADGVLGSTGATGALVLSWQAEHGVGEVLAARGTVPAGPREGTRVNDGESRVALAAKHGVGLAYADWQRERDRLPLCAAGEQWDVQPGSATIQPLAVSGRVVGAVVAWHNEPDHFGERQQEFLRLLGVVAPGALQNARRYEALDRRASTDALTGLPNRHTFDARLAAIATYYERYARPFGLLVLDVDFFKKFNDTWGHEAGDRVLQHVAQVVRSTIREVDLPARLGGEEFVVLMPETRLKEALDVAERVREALETHPVIWNGRPLPVTASVGAAACPDCGDNPDRLLAAADAALYDAKAAGRNRVCAARAAVPPRPDGVDKRPA